GRLGVLHRRLRRPAPAAVRAQSRRRAHRRRTRCPARADSRARRDALARRPCAGARAQRPRRAERAARRRLGGVLRRAARAGARERHRRCAPAQRDGDCIADGRAVQGGARRHRRRSRRAAGRCRRGTRCARRTLRRRGRRSARAAPRRSCGAVVDRGGQALGRPGWLGGAQRRPLVARARRRRRAGCAQPVARRRRCGRGVGRRSRPARLARAASRGHRDAGARRRRGDFDAGSAEALSRAGVRAARLAGDPAALGLPSSASARTAAAAAVEEAWARLVERDLPAAAERSWLRFFRFVLDLPVYALAIWVLYHVIVGIWTGTYAGVDFLLNAALLLTAYLFAIRLAVRRGLGLRAPSLLAHATLPTPHPLPPQPAP